eukprot:TRINITY_DN7084_c0_g1_i1.p1 TRINITY_DN7084_c0_g1~~TRINITY_DN7084_c0_g1_i1.p1  ORF type:complete len:291 (+),score=64.00 TRINITY_DN7084_c0_g1_i1:60-932(+)
MNQFWILGSSLVVAVGSLVLYRVYFSKRQDSSFSLNLTAYELTDEALCQEVREKMAKPVEKLPVHLDLPRLARKMEIIYDDQIVLEAKEGGEDQYFMDPEERSKRVTEPKEAPLNPHEVNSVMKSIFMTLAQYLDEESVMKKIEENFGKYVTSKPNTDVSRHLLDFLLEVMGDDNSTVGVLKASNQSILAPAVIRLKSTVGSKFPYKDIRGGWRIVVTISSHEQRIRITHRRWEQSFQQGDFKFSWEFHLDYDINMEELQDCHIDITHVIATDPSLKRNLLAEMKPFLRQ